MMNLVLLTILCAATPVALAAGARREECRRFPSCLELDHCGPDCEAPRCVPDAKHDCEYTTFAHTTYMFGVSAGSAGARGFEVGVIPAAMRADSGGGYSGFALGVGDYARRRVFFEYFPSFLVFAPSWYAGFGAGSEPERGPFAQATIGAGFLALVPHLRLMAFPRPRQLATEVGISLLFGAIGNTSTHTYQRRVRR